MHVVLKRRGVSMRVSWDGVAKPVQKQSSHWARIKPNSPTVNDNFIVNSNVTLFSDSIFAETHSVSTFAANVTTVNMTSTMTAMYDISDEDLALSASMTRSSYGARFITALIATASYANTPSIGMTSTVGRALLFDKYKTNDSVSSLAVARQVLDTMRLAEQVTFNNVSAVSTDLHPYNSLTLSAHWTQVNESTLQPSHEYAEDAYILKAPLPDSALLEEDDPRQYDALEPTDEDFMAIQLDSKNTVPDFFTSARVRPTLFYTGSQLAVDDGHSRRIGMPIIRLRMAREPFIIADLSHDTLVTL